MDVAQRVRREAKTRPVVSPLAAGPHAQGAPRSLGSKKSFDALHAAAASGSASSATGSATQITDARHEPSLPSIPSPPGLTYSSSEYSSSETDLSSSLESSLNSLNHPAAPIRQDSSDLENSHSRSDHSISQNEKGGHLPSHSHSHSHPHRHPRQNQESTSRDQHGNSSLNRSASSSTPLKLSSSSSPSKSRQRPREKRTYRPQGQRAGSVVPLSFSGEYDSDGEPVFVDECDPRRRAASAPTILSNSTSTRGDQTPPVTVVLQDVGNEDTQLRVRSTPRSKRTLTVFDTFSFPMPPTPGASRSPIPRSPAYHRATASESLIHSPLRQNMSAAPPVPAINSSKALQDTHRSNSQRRQAMRPLPLAPPLPLTSSGVGSSPSKGGRNNRLLSPRSASAGGIGELESFLSLNSPMPSAALHQQQQHQGEVERSLVGGFEKPYYAGGDALAFGGGADEFAPLGSARAQDTGIDLLIGMVDAAIVA